MSRFGPSSEAEFWRFLLLRTIHDLGNSISGILTLSNHHLRNGPLAEEVGDSFKLIQESAESARQMLIAVGSLTDEGMQGRELTLLSDFLSELVRQLQIIVPRSVSLHMEPGSNQTVIEVDQCYLRQALIMLVAANCLSLGAKSGNIRFGQEEESGKIWIAYSSEPKMDSDFVRRAADIFERLNFAPADLVWSETGEELKLRIGFLPVTDLASEAKAGGAKEATEAYMSARRADTSR